MTAPTPPKQRGQRGEPGTWKFLVLWENGILLPKETLGWLPTSDLDSALLIQQERAGSLRYAHGSRQWYLRDGEAWRKDDGGTVEKAVTDYAIRLDLAIKALKEEVRQQVVRQAGLEKSETEIRERQAEVWEPFEAAAGHAAWLKRASGQAAVLKMLSVACGAPDGEAEGRQPLALVPAAEVWEQPDLAYLVDGWIPQTGVGALFGETGTWKSFLALHLLLCVVYRLGFLGQPVNRPGRGVYLLGEGQAGARRRLRSAIADLAVQEKIAPAGLDYVMVPFPLSDERAVTEVVTVIRARAGTDPVSLVVFDAAADFYGADDSEISATDMQRIIAACKRISRELGCFVLLV